MLSITTLRPDNRDADEGVLGWAMAWSTFGHATFVAALLAGGVQIGSAESGIQALSILRDAAATPMQHAS